MMDPATLVKQLSCHSNPYTCSMLGDEAGDRDRGIGKIEVVARFRSSSRAGACQGFQ